MTTLLSFQYLSIAAALVIPAAVAALFSVDIKEIIIFVTWVCLVAWCLNSTFELPTTKQEGIEMVREVGDPILLPPSAHDPVINNTVCFCP